MFFTYLRRELRRRVKQAVVVAVGLAIGIGLVVVVSATSAGVKTAQAQVLHSLYGVGTDLTVTMPAKPSSGGFQHFGTFRRASGSQGSHVARKTLRPSIGSATLPESDVGRVDHLHGTAASVGGLTLTDTSFSGTIPAAPSTGTSSGGFGAPRGQGLGFTISTFTVDGVQIDNSGVGPLSASEVTDGSYFSKGNSTADVAIVSSSYAKTDKLAVGSKLTVAGTSVNVIGVADQTSGSTDVYLPLATAQNLAGVTGKVTNIYVAASNATSVTSLAADVKKLIPGATVATSASLASDISGSLSSASHLATNLGKWLSIGALVVAILLAGLLMLSAVTRRVREFGTLKALGWRTRRIVGQVMGEGLALGILGGVTGLVLGVVGAEIISAVSPSLTATVGSPAALGAAFGGFGGGGAGTPFGGGATSPGFHRPARAGSFSHHGAAAVHTVAIHLTAPLQGGAIGLALGLAILGGLVAGAFGAWRAGRLRPATALRRVE
ncbi:MAG: ABC transporter permease [Actinomycetota bacterium]|nr:ABC transporter permease [Actinomycetota bacterium]